MTEVTMSQLIAYDPERDLLPLILAHCNYSLEVGQETLVQYDWAALERQLIDRFLRGRPFVEFKVNRVPLITCAISMFLSWGMMETASEFLVLVSLNKHSRFAKINNSVNITDLSINTNVNLLVLFSRKKTFVSQAT